MARFLLSTVLMLCILTGCSIPVHKEWVATGGSKADGVVRLSIEYMDKQTPIVDEEQALKIARERCAVWGYSNALAFGGVTRQCLYPGTFGCGAYQETKEYQCTND